VVIIREVSYFISLIAWRSLGYFEKYMTEPKPTDGGGAPNAREPARASGERRQTTVLFADMAGFTAISERLGEEDTYTLIQPIYELMAAAVQEQGGTVKDFTGDGIMALFGVPAALEDAPLRACKAALQIQERLAGAAPGIEAKHGVRPLMRIGINTGPVVVAQVRGGEAASVTAIGDTVNLASRLQTLAEPGSVLLSEAAHRLVQGLVESVSVGEHQIKGKSEPQRVYRLNAIRRGAIRFDTALSRGLTAYVGRDLEIATLESELEQPSLNVRAISIIADPGMGKSRLLHEFRQRIGGERAFLLTGSCSPDGKQTPFLPFIDVVRSSFGISIGEAESAIQKKLGDGLTVLSLASAHNLGLLLNLLGLKVPDDALSGLDGTLIGLRTRDLLLQILKAQCSSSPVVMLLEDLHWIDNVSEELLDRIISLNERMALLIVHTSRPEYRPPWTSKVNVTVLSLAPLSRADTSQIVRSRLGASELPEVLARLIADRAEGNALFAEEIAGFLVERNIVRVPLGLEFDEAAVARALPDSLHSLLVSRVDRLAPGDRSLLQAAAVIGREFDPELLSAVAASDAAIEERLLAMRSLDLVHRSEKTGAFAFKHALVRDALYDSLLSGTRTLLHLKIAEEIERRSGNRLVEVAEVLAHHYGKTDRATKAFNYLAMAGQKSLQVYSLAAADAHFEVAIALLHQQPNCANDDQFADFMVDYTLFLNLEYRITELVSTVERHLQRLDMLGDDPRSIRIRHQQVFALVWTARFREAETAQRSVSLMASRVDDDQSRAYSLAGEILVSTVVAPKSLDAFEAVARDAVAAASKTNDVYIQTWVQFVIGWDEFHRGRIHKARKAADELATAGERLGDPRATSEALALAAWIALVSDDYTGALQNSEDGLKIAITKWDEIAFVTAKTSALVMLRRPEGLTMLQEFRSRCLKNGWNYSFTGTDGIWGIALVLDGRIAKGIRFIKNAIAAREREGYQSVADWYRLFLCDVYLEIIAGKEKPSISVLLKNIPILLQASLVASSRIKTLVAQFRENPHFDPSGQHFGRMEMVLGLLAKAKRKRGLAVQHLTEAHRITVQFGASPMLTKIDAALAELHAVGGAQS
jgi:class 3 adenylate cyclase